MPLRLHVVYAGFGDAFVLEDGNELWAIDGGPLGRTPQSQGGAPYYRYLKAALESAAVAVGQQPAGRVTLSGIVVSHAHLDHYGGIVELLNKTVSRTYARAPTKKWPFKFDGPLVSQPLDDVNETGQWELLSAAEEFYDQQDGPAPEAIGPFRFGADADYPRIIFGRQAPAAGAVPLVGKTWTIDTSPDNLASVLMLHKAGRMVFTGDSVGNKILNFIGDVVEAADQPLWIFKVPHHGSRRNSQRTDAVASVPAQALHEYALLALTLREKDWDLWRVPPALQEQPGAMAVVKAEVEALCPGQGVDFGALVAELKTKVRANLRAAAAGWPIAWQYAAIETAPIWRAICTQLEARAIIGVKDKKKSLKRKADDMLEGVPSSWAAALQSPKVLAEPFLAEVAFTEMKAFYNSFAAYNYVISANGTHRHPAPEVIAAIAATRGAADPTARVFVTSAASIDLQRIADLAGPAWREKVDLRALSAGDEIILDLSAPANAVPPIPATPPVGTASPIDPGNTTVSVASIAEPNREQLHQRLEANPGASIPGRAPAGGLFTVQIPPPVQGGQILYLALDHHDEPSVTANKMTFTVEEAWVLQPPQPNVTIVRLDAPQPNGDRLFGLISRAVDRWALSLGETNGVTEYVSTDAAHDYRTTNPADPKLALFKFVRAAPEGAPAPLAELPRPASSATTEPTLRAFLEAAGLPTDAPLSGREALAALAGPTAAAAIVTGTAPPVLGRVFGWEADLDGSTVTWSSDAEGLLAEAATVAVKVGTPATFTIEGTIETIVSTWLTLTRGEELTVTVGLKTADGTELDHPTTIAAPGRGRPLAEYLTAVGVPAAEQDEVTVAGLLSRMLGGQSLVERLLMNAPSFIAAAGIGTAKLDLATSEVETFASPTGGLDVLTAQLTPKQSAISATVAGVALTLEEPAFTVEGALMPGASLALTAVAKITPKGLAPVRLQASTVLTDERPELTLSLAEGATLAQAIALLPGAPALGNLEVPVAGGTLGTVTLSSLGLSLRQPVEDADAYIVSSVFGSIEWSGWAEILPTGFPAVTGAKVGLAVFDPEDAVQRRVGFEGQVAFAMPKGGALAAAIRAWPMAGAGQTTAVDRGLAKSLTVWADPEKQLVTLAEIVSAFGLADTASVPAPLAGLLAGIALEEIDIELADAETGGTEVASFAIALSIAQTWEPLSGFALTAGQLDLRYDGTEWNGEVAATMLLAETIPIEVGYVVPSTTTPGNFIFAPVGGLSLKVAAEAIGLGALTGVPLLGTLLEKVSVTEVSLALKAGTQTVPTVVARTLEMLLDEIVIGPLTVDGVSLALTRTVPESAGEEAQTNLWIEAELGGNAILEVGWDSKKGKLAGSLRMLEPRTLNQLLATLLGDKGPANVLLPLVGEFAVVAAAVEFDTAGSQLKAFRLDLDPSKALKLGPATVTELGIVYEAGAGEQPTTYALTGRLSGKNVGAKIEVGCQAETGTTNVTASIKSVGPGAEALTLQGLVSIFELSAPTVPPLHGAPNFLTIEISEVTAKLSYAAALELQALKVKVQSTTAITLVATTPPLELEQLSLTVNYEKAVSQALTGTIFGKLTIPSSPAVTLELEYSLDSKGVGVFEGDLSVTENQPSYGALLEGGPFDPGAGGGLPTNIGLPAKIPMAQLTVRVEMPPSPAPTSVTVSGYAQSTTWEWDTLGIHFAVKELGGEVEVTAPASSGGPLQYRCSLFGALTFGQFDGRATLAFGATEHTVLTAVMTEAQTVSIPAVAGMLSGGGEAAWTEVVPAGTAPLAFAPGSKGYAYLDFTAGSFALLGSLAGFGVGALVSHPGTGGARSFAFLAALSSSFRFANLWAQLAPVDQYVAVRAANLALIDYGGGVAELKLDIAAVEKAAAAEGVTLEAPFAGLDWVGEPGIGPSQLTKGGAFFADLALSPAGTLSHNLESMTAEPGAAAAIALYALVDHAEPKNTVYTGTITNLTLLGGGLVLAGALTYRPGVEVAQLEAAGSMTVKLEPGEAGYKFEGKLTLGTAKAEFEAVTTGTPITIVDPFGGMFGISIVEAALTAEFDFGAQGTTSTIVVSGKVAFKVVIQVQMTAAIVFLDGRPALVRAELPGTLSIEELLQGIGLPWPSGYEVLTLEKGSMYYAPTAVAIGGVTYEQGYHLATTAKVLGKPIAIDVEVASAGILAKAEVEGGFDFYFLQLTGYEESGHVHKGPFVQISTRSPTSFTIGAGVSLFHTALASTTLTYRTSPLSDWLGSVAVAPSVPVLGGSTVEFTYSDADGFRLTNMGLLSDAIKWAELANQLIDASSGTPCGKLVGLAWDDVVTTKANVKFTQDGAPDSRGLPFALTGTFDISVAGSVVLTMPLPTLHGVVPKPNEFKLEELPAWLVETLTKNLLLMAKSLFEEREKLVAFIGALATLTATKAGLTALICDGVKTENVAAETTAEVDAGVTEAAGETAALSGEAATAMGLEKLAEFAAAAIVLAGLFAGLVAVVEELLALIDEALSWLGLSDKKDEAERERNKAKAKLDEVEARMQAILTMGGAPGAAFAAGSATRVLVTWTDADRPAKEHFDYEGYGGITYLAQVSSTPDFSGAVSAEVAGASSPIELELPALATANNGYVRIRAVHRQGGKEWRGPWKEAAAPAFHKVPMAAPASVTQALDGAGDLIAVTVARVDGATAYTATLVDPNHPSVVLLHQQVVAPSLGPAVASLDTRLLPDTVATGASLVALGVAEGNPAVSSPSPPTASAPLTTAAPPSVPTVTVEAGGLHVTWPTAQLTPRPQVRVEVGGTLLSPQPQALAWDADGKGCLLGVEGIAPGATAGVEMRLPDPTHVALWSSPPAAVVVAMVAAPGHFAALFDGVATALVMSWDADPEASHWEAECRAAGGGALSPPPTITTGPTGATVSGPAIAAGSSYEVRARGTAPGSVSTWGAWTEVSAAVVAAPAGVALAVEAMALKATWDTVATGTYRVRLLALPARTVVGEAAPSGAEASFDLKAPVPPESECEVEVRALVGTSLGLAGTATATTPSLLGLVEAARAGSMSAAEASGAASAYQRALGYAELLVTLAAAGYPIAEAEAATLAKFPGSNLAPLVAALPKPALLAPLLVGATPPVRAAAIVRLTAKLFAGKAVELAIQLRLGGLAQADVAAALPSAYPGLTPAAATAIAASAYVEPWALGAQLFAGPVAEEQVVPDLLDAYPTLPALRAMAALNANYEVGRDSKPVGAALAAKYGEEWGVALGALLDRSGRATATHLHEEGVPRAEATAYVAAAFPGLSSQAVNEAIEAAYGPSG